MNVLAQALEKTGNNQSELARQLKVRQPSLNEMLNGKRPVPPWVTTKAAQIAGCDATAIAFEALAAHAKTAAERQTWEERRRALGRTAVCLLCCAMIAGPVLPQHDQKSRGNSSTISTLYIM